MSRKRDLLDRYGPPLAALGLALAGREWLRRRLTPTEELRGKVVLITGSSRGLGLALAQEFAAHGARLVLCARNEGPLEVARQQLAHMGAETLAVPCDVSDRAQVERLVQAATQRFGRIDVLVNNAGIITVGPVASQTLGDIEDAMGAMFWGVVYPTLAVLPQMRARRSGHIVNVTSVGGKVSVPHLLAYNSAKFAAVGFSEGLRAEVTKDGIAVTTVVPGLMRTGSPVNAYFKGRHRLEYTWFSLLGNAPFTSLSARDSARMIVEATRRGEPEVILGWQAGLLARANGLFPGLMTETLGLVNWLLPDAEPSADPQQRWLGKESETPLTQSFLTALGQRAAQQFNQYAGDPGDSRSRTGR